MYKNGRWIKNGRIIITCARIVLPEIQMVMRMRTSTHTRGVTLTKVTMAVKALNPKADVARAAQALQLNINGARGLQEVMRTNLGPKGTMKM